MARLNDRDVEVRVSDGDVEARVKEALLRQTESAGLDVRVDAQDGVVQLSGVVDVLGHGQRAEEIARGVPGVKGIANAITVSTDGQITDEHIRKELRERLEGNEETRTVGAEVHGGRVTLVGRVDNLAQAQQAYRLASGTRGVRDVYSDIHLASHTPDDIDVTNDVEQALHFAGLNAKHIDASTKDNRVTLEGWVDDEAERQRVVDLVSGVEGVRGIEDRLGLRQEKEEV